MRPRRLRVCRCHLRLAVLAGVVTALAATLAVGARSAPRIALPPKPQVVIVAQFVPQDFATYYTAKVTPVAGLNDEYGWKLTPPKNDPGCNRFTVNPDDDRQAVWDHGDQDGCDHTKMGPQGHQGVVTLYYDDAFWSCDATYSGTNDGTSLPAACESRVRASARSAIRAAIADEQDALENLHRPVAAQDDLDSALNELAHAKAAADKLTLSTVQEIDKDVRLATKSDKFAKADIKGKDLEQAKVDLHDALGDKKRALAAIAALR